MFNILKYSLREGIVEGTDLATLAHLEDPVLLRGTYIINSYFTK